MIVIVIVMKQTTLLVICIAAIVVVAVGLYVTRPAPEPLPDILGSNIGEYADHTPDPTAPPLTPMEVPSLYGIHPIVGGYVMHNGAPQSGAMIYWDGYPILRSSVDGMWNCDPASTTGDHTVYAEYKGERSQTYSVTCGGDVRLDLVIG